VAAVRIAMVTQAMLAAGSLAVGVPLLAGWMRIWYLVPLSFVIGCVQCARAKRRPAAARKLAIGISVDL
jgi:hypothetical protein